MAEHFILMGDVIDSRRQDAGALRRALKELVARCNQERRCDILSPYTITLGDEFQGVGRSLRGCIRCIFFFEDARLENPHPFKFHYVVHLGEIQTPINPDIAYEMMGPGLAKARELLTDKSRDRPRFWFDLPDPKLTHNLNRLFSVLEKLDARWKLEDYPLIFDMLRESNNEEVATMHGKNRSQIWKRRSTLLVDEYSALRDVVLDLAAETG